VTVVFDANLVVVTSAGRGGGWLCLIRLAGRRAFAYGALATIEETRVVRHVSRGLPKNLLIQRQSVSLGSHSAGAGSTA
jgi:hypothetical protein